MSSSDAGESSRRGRPLGLRRDGALMVVQSESWAAVKANLHIYNTTNMIHDKYLFGACPVTRSFRCRTIRWFQPQTFDDQVRYELGAFFVDYREHLFQRAVQACPY